MLENDRFVDAPRRAGRRDAWDRRRRRGDHLDRQSGRRMSCACATTAVPPQATPWTALGQRSFVTAIAGDPRRGVWLGFNDGGLLHFDGAVQACARICRMVCAFGTRQQSPLRPCTGTLWIASEGGLTRREKRSVRDAECGQRIAMRRHAMGPLRRCWSHCGWPCPADSFASHPSEMAAWEAADGPAGHRQAGAGHRLRQCRRLQVTRRDVAYLRAGRRRRRTADCGFWSTFGVFVTRSGFAAVQSPAAAGPHRVR